jgi:hypothetical protein
MLLMLGLAPLFNSLDNPRVQTLHGADIVRLIAAGFCFGGAFGFFIATSKFTSNRRES